MEDLAGLAQLAGLGNVDGLKGFGDMNKGGMQSLKGLQALSHFGGAKGGKDLTSLLMSPQGIQGLSALASVTGQKPSPLTLLKMLSWYWIKI